MPLTGTFECSFVALLAELWAELEAVLGADGAGGDGLPHARRRAELRAQALVLELVLIADRCDCARWQALIGAAQVERVRFVVTGLHALLDFSPFELDSPRARGAIVRAQNFLFEEVSRAAQARMQWAPRATAPAVEVVAPQMA
jgi:hypothetical protein